jgi:hypothetical protein
VAPIDRALRMNLAGSAPIDRGRKNPPPPDAGHIKARSFKQRYPKK